MIKKQEPKTEKKEIEELTETLQRLQADFENYKKRIEKENLERARYAKAEVIVKLLPVLDSFELALKNSKNHEEFKKGVELIYSQFFQTLEDMGLRPVQTNGKFDPYKHEVLLTETSDKEDGTILEELQKGYALNERIIRHSKIKVAKKKSGDNNGKGDSSNEYKC